MNKIRNLLRHNIVLKIISVIAAILFWIYVQMVQNPDIEYTFTKMPVNLVNTNYLQKEGFVLPDKFEAFVDVAVKCQRWKLNEIGREDFTAYVDLTEVHEDGDVTLPVKVRVNNENIVVANKTPSSVTIFVDKMIKEEIPLELRLNGNLKSGFYTDENLVSTTTQKAVVTGPSTLISKIDKAVAEIDISDRNDSFTQECKIILVDCEEKAVTNDTLTIVPQNAEVNVRVLAKKVVPIEISGIAPNIQYEILPGGLEIAGSSATLNAISKFTIQDFHLLSTHIGYEQKYKISVPNDVILLSEGEITVKITQNAVEVPAENQ